MSQYAYVPGGAITITSCPRSGSSISALIEHTVHGEDMFLGYQFPQENAKRFRKELLKELKEENPSMYEVRKYLFEQAERQQEAETPKSQREYHDMNPDGFWEMEFTVQGIRYNPRMKQVFDDFKKGQIKFCKVVSQGLLASDPLYIKKIIYSIRHPRAVAKSQERLIRGFNYVDDKGEVRNAFENTVVHSPDMFIQVTGMAAQFFLLNPRIPVLFYHFEDLIKDPKTEIDRRADFVGFGDYTKAYDLVKPSLNRSTHEEDDSPIWKDADYVYENFCEAADHRNNGNWRKAKKLYTDIVKYLSDPDREVNRQKSFWRCPRAKQRVNAHICDNCIKNPQARANMRRNSVKTKGKFTKHYAFEPCLYECGFDRKREHHPTIQESIDNNSWLDKYEVVPGVEVPPELIEKLPEESREGIELIPVFNDKARAPEEFSEIDGGVYIDGKKYDVIAIDTPDTEIVEAGDTVVMFVRELVEDTFEEPSESKGCSNG